MTNTLDKFNAAIFASIIIGLSVWSSGGFKLPTSTNAEAVITGHSATEVEQHYQKAFPIKDIVTNVWGAFNYQIFNEGREGVEVGVNAWLFSQEEYQLSADYQNNLDANTNYIITAVNALQKKGIESHIVVIPEKVEIYSDRLARVTPHNTLDLRDQVKSILINHSLSVVDPYPALITKQDGDTFLRTDTHWSPLGAKLSANWISHSLPALQGQTQFRTEYIEDIPLRGDLLTFIPVSPYLESLGPAGEMLPVFQTQKIAEETASLFGDDSLPSIALVGTSYSANEKWHFHGYLQQALKQDILNYAVEGKGPFSPMAAFLSQSDADLAGIDTVIWEIPVRYFVKPLPQDIASSMTRNPS
ncbi:hypothetical protein OE749_09380 [Aestuariibacter sp. AA17]|uniref:AlgX/AlgJ SGNH hydrolase-like domain-containing protein n=1 Tax=Fluctibacter corallii TaxID=2984329 RepID=A0ABT3A8A9_9ALTE|nr:hypothetical protein [Aestuariibacter sp. AA17]MCV2884906.1 hypothetical protein [Aestuariibacter sp. AA17]